MLETLVTSACIVLVVNLKSLPSSVITNNFAQYNIIIIYYNDFCAYLIYLHVHVVFMDEIYKSEVY